MTVDHIDSPSDKPLLRALRSGAPLVMGILNVTPDSFSDGGQYIDAAPAVAQAELMATEGAALIDIGGESTRPGFQPVDEATEAGRVLPVVERLAGRPGPALSIDTTKAAVARAAVAAGAAVINDQWGFQGDPAMADTVAEAGAVAILMHNSATIDPDRVMADALPRFFETSLSIASRAGVLPEHLVLDPGIGFGKTPAQQIEALRAIPGLRKAFGLPVLVGVSRKSFLGRLTGSPVDGRLPETLAANLFAYGQGARLFRVHDVGPHVRALAVCQALGDTVEALA